MRRPLLAQLAYLLELGGGVELIQPLQAAPPRELAVRVGGEFGRGLGQRGRASWCAAGAGVAGGLFGAFGERLVWFVGAAGQVPRGLVRVS